MRKINTNDLAEITWSSPKGKFSGAGRQVSEALGRKPFSTDLKERHPFDVAGHEAHLRGPDHARGAGAQSASQLLH